MFGALGWQFQFLSDCSFFLRRRRFTLWTIFSGAGHQRQLGLGTGDGRHGVAAAAAAFLARTSRT